MRTISRLIALFAFLAIQSTVGVTDVNESPTSVFKNPLNQVGPDPWTTYHEGFYYFTRTSGNGVDIWKSRTLTGIDHGERKTVYTPETGLKDIWAPEIHRLNGKWYIYFTGNTGCGDKCRGIYVLENSAADPLSGTWVAKGRVNTGPGLDGTVFLHNGKMYFAYGGYDEFWSSIYIAQMSNPWTLSSTPVRLAHREQPWESDLLEGPEALIRNGRVSLAYSTYPCWSDNYRLGLLSASASANLLDPASWSKSTGPVFQGANGVYAPGHNGFTRSKDGTEDWMVYHANSQAGQGCGARPSRAQKFMWKADGTPDFGQPAAESTCLPVPSGEYTIEAEHTLIHNATIIRSPGASNGSVVGNIGRIDGFVLFNHINVPTPGIYKVIVRYRNPGRRRATHNLEINGRKAPPVTYLSTRGRNTYATATLEAAFERGYKNSLRFSTGVGRVELDRIELFWSGSLTSTPNSAHNRL